MTEFQVHPKLNRSEPYRRHLNRPLNLAFLGSCLMGAFTVISWHFEPSNVRSSSVSLRVVPSGASPVKEIRQVRDSGLETAGARMT